MSSFIPYNHPSLVLGNVVDTKVLDCFKQITACQRKVDAEQDKLNALIMTKRSINMTMNELKGLSVNTSQMSDKIKALDENIQQASLSYITAQLTGQDTLLTLRQTLSELTITDIPESPLDMNSSTLQPVPSFSDSLSLDSQYFSFNSNMENDALANIEKFVRSGTSNMADKSNQITNAVAEQVGNQIKSKNLCGTLIITANCTHRNINIFNPLVIDPDKAVNAWNHQYGDDDCIDKENIPDTPSQSNHALHIITGAVYGSSFVGMVHILKSDISETGDFDSLKEQLEQKLRIGGWLQNATGSFGVNPEVLQQVKAFLSTQSLSTHISIVAMGVIPTIKANEVQYVVKELSAVDPTTRNTILNGFHTDTKTTASQADQSNQQALLMNIQNARMASMMTALGSIEQQKNNILDINTLMQALDHYIQCAKSTNQAVGVPISFYTRNLTKSDIIELLQKK
ncbi:MAG: hypothetical protein RR555_02690 [Bacteroidales bacterium]